MKFNKNSFNFVGAFSFWLSRISETIAESIKNNARAYEEAINQLDGEGRHEEAETLKLERESVLERSKVEASKIFVKEFVNQYGSSFLQKFIALTEDDRFEDFFMDMAASENLKSVTLDPTLPHAERMSAKSRSDRAAGCLIPFEVIMELARKGEYVREFEKEVDEEASSTLK